MHDGQPRFTTDYRAARERFGAAAHTAGARLTTLPVAGLGPRGEALAVDVATLGEDEEDATLLVPSGLHGVEGAIGSAVQTAWLSRQQAPPIGVRVVLVHALNPWGFAHGRRTDEANIDLNRNFLLPGESHRGAPPGFADLAALAAPRTPAPAVEAFALRALARVVVHGLPALRSALSVGQQQHPQGLFFAGHDEAAVTRLVRSHCKDWLGRARRLLHLDLHSGLGRHGGALLLALCAPGSPDEAWLRNTFARATVCAEGGKNCVIDEWRGLIGQWLTRGPGARLEHCLSCTLEFGTVGPITAFAALRAENRAWWHSPAHLPAARERLRETFAPSSPAWRAGCTHLGTSLLDHAVERWPRYSPRGHDPGE